MVLHDWAKQRENVISTWGNGGGGGGEDFITFFMTNQANGPL
jgi:hypothetical protein